MNSKASDGERVPKVVYIDENGVRWARLEGPCLPPYRPRPARATDAELGMAWWNNLAESERAEWLRRAGSAVPADAWEAFKSARP